MPGSGRLSAMACTPLASGRSAPPVRSSSMLVPGAPTRARRRSANAPERWMPRIRGAQRWESPRWHRSSSRRRSAVDGDPRPSGVVPANSWPMISGGRRKSVEPTPCSRSRRCRRRRRRRAPAVSRGRLVDVEQLDDVRLGEDQGALGFSVLGFRSAGRRGLVGRGCGGEPRRGGSRRHAAAASAATRWTGRRCGVTSTRGRRVGREAGRRFVRQHVERANPSRPSSRAASRSAGSSTSAPRAVLTRWPCDRGLRAQPRRRCRAASIVGTQQMFDGGGERDERVVGDDAGGPSVTYGSHAWTGTRGRRRRAASRPMRPRPATPTDHGLAAAAGRSRRYPSRWRRRRLATVRRLWA